MLQYFVGIVIVLSLLSAVIAQEDANQLANLDALVAANFPLQKNEQIVFVGDSITMQGGFVELIDQALREKQPALEVKVTRHGLNGGRVPDMTEGKTPWGEMKPFAEILTEEKPTVLILYLGINDVMHSPGTSPEEFEQGLTELVKAAQRTGAVVVLATPAVNGENIDPESADQQKLDDYAKITRQVAQTQSAALCDLRQAFVEHLQAHNPEHKPHGLLTYDGVHMSDAGNRLIAEQMSQAIATAVRGRQATESTETPPTEDWVYLQNADLRVGLLRSHGGAIAYLSSPSADFNTLNHYDHGRLVQQSYYGDEDGSLWGDKPWRYNPVQGGDYQGKAAKVVEFNTTATTAYVKTSPRHWASGKLIHDCTMEQWVHLEGPLLRVRYKFDYHGDTTHQRRHQETPAVFVSPRLATLVTYTGEKPWTSAALTRTRPGWPNQYLALPESWAAYVDEEGNGVGVYVPGVSEATCYRFEGGGGSNCSYIAPLKTFALTPNLSFEYTAYFTLGDADTIRQRFAALHREP